MIKKDVITETLLKELTNYVYDSFTSISGVKEIISMAKLPFTIKDNLFLKKLELFTRGVPNIPIDDYQYLSDDNKTLLKENLIVTLDKIDSSKKIDYLIKIFNSFYNKEISIEEYYRLNHIIMNLTPFEIDFFLNYCCDRNILDSFLKENSTSTLDEFETYLPDDQKYYINEFKDFGILDSKIKNKDFYLSNGLIQPVRAGKMISNFPYIMTPLGKKFKTILKRKS